jgi:hypothetical protein
MHTGSLKIGTKLLASDSLRVRRVALDGIPGATKKHSEGLLRTDNTMHLWHDVFSLRFH